MKKTILTILALLIIFILFECQEVKAETTDNISSTYEELIGYAENIYYLGEEAAGNTYNITEILISNDTVVLEYNACVDFVDIIGVLQDGQYVNITRLVEYAIENDEIASFEMGKIKGVDQGTTTIPLHIMDIAAL